MIVKANKCTKSVGAVEYNNNVSKQLMNSWRKWHHAMSE